MRKQLSSLTAAQIISLKQRYENMSVQELVTAVSMLNQKIEHIKRGISQFESRKITMKAQSRQMTQMQRGQQSQYLAGEQKRLGTLLADAEKELSIAEASHRRLASRMQREHARSIGFRR